MLELNHRCGCFAAEIFDRVLVAEPVGTFDGIVHVPLPMVGSHVTKAGSDSALRSDRMTAGRKDLGHACRLEALSCRAHRRPQASAPGADHHDVIRMINDLVGAQATPPNAISASAKSANAPPPTARNRKIRLTAKLLPGWWT